MAFTLFDRVIDHWPLKVAAIVVAVILWLFVSTTSIAVTQRSLLIPIHIEGLNPDQVGTGIPDYAEVTISGPHNRINRLNPESLYAFIELSGKSGTFEGSIEVSMPKRVDLVSLTPSEVIGTVELVSTKVVPVAVAFQGPIPGARWLRTLIDPTEALVRGRSSALDQVAQVTAPMKPTAGTFDLAIFATDVAGLPVPEIKIQPNTVKVTLDFEHPNTTRTVPLIVGTPDVSGLLVKVISEHHLIELSGPEELLATVNTVSGVVEFPTRNPLPGDYNLSIRVILPEGLTTNFISTAVVRIETQP